MKGNNGKRRIGLSWLSVLLIVAMLTPMFSAIALAEEFEEKAPAFDAGSDQVYEEIEKEASTDPVEKESSASYDAPEEKVEKSERQDDDDDGNADDDADASDSDTSKSDTSDADETDGDETDGDENDGDGDGAETDGGDEEKSDGEKPGKTYAEGLYEAEEDVTGGEGAKDDEESDALDPDDRIVGTTITIFDFDDLGVDDFEVVSKPDKAEFIKTLPTKAVAVLSDGSKTTVSITWECDDDYAYKTEDYGAFTFSAVLGKDTVYKLDDKAVMPKVTLFVVYISAVEVELLDIYYSDYKPASMEMVGSELNFPSSVKGTLQTLGGDRELTLPVVWECDNYDDEDLDTFLFTAQFDPIPEYLIDESVEMPVLTLEVMSEFRAKIDKDKGIAKITWWKGGSDTLTIPENIGGYPVEEIAADAFAGHTELRDVKEMPKCVKKIGARAFANCMNLTFVTLTDSLTDVASSAFDNASDDLSITLVVYGGETTLSSQNQFKHDKDIVELPRDIGSLVVKGNLTVAANFTVDSGNNYNYIDVKSGGTLTLEKGFNIYNKSDIVVSGSFVNNGSVYGCFAGSSLTGTIDKYVKDHTYEGDSQICKICNVPAKKAEKKLSVKRISGDYLLNKSYDGKKTCGLTVANFELDKTAVDDDDKDKVSLLSVTATFDDSQVGDRVVTVKFTLDQAKDCKYNYTLAAMTEKGSITKKELSDPDVGVSSIEDQKYTGKAIEPDVTVKWSGLVLTKDVDYSIAYENNTKVGVATATVTGRGSFTGSVKRNFNIVQGKESKALTLTYTGAGKVSMTYDGTNAVALSPANFTLTGVASGDVVEIQSVLAKFDNVNAGNNHTVKIKATLKQTKATYDYTAECTIKDGVITPQSIRAAKLSAIPDQKQTGAAVEPDVEMTYNGMTLVKGRDYKLTYANNVAVGTATVTIEGIGNFSGSQTATFKIVASSRKKKTLTATLIGEADKEYDGTTKSSLTVSDFTLETGEIPDEDVGRVKITGVNAYYDDKNAGERQLMVFFELSQASATYEYEVAPIRMDAEITPRTLTVYPIADQYKIYGTRDPAYYNGIVKGLLRGDVVKGEMGREDGEDVGPYAYTLGTLNAGDNYQFEDIGEDAETFAIKKKNLASADITVKFDAEVYRTRDGKEVEPDITVTYHKYDDDVELEDGTDYTVKFTDNTKRGTGYAIITAVNDETCNYTGSRIESFRIKKEHSGGGGSSSSSDDDDYDDDEDEDEEEDEEPTEPGEGELWIGDEENPNKVGYILFGEDNRPRPFDSEVEDIEPETPEAGDTEVLDTAPQAPQTYGLDADGNPILPKRLYIRPTPLMDANDEPIPLDSDGSRDKYEQHMQLRLTPFQVDMIEGQHITELVYQIENAEMHVPLEKLVYDIDVAPLKQDETETTETVSEETWDEDSAETGETFDEIAGSAEDETTLAPELVRVYTYVFTIDQVAEDNMTGRETSAMEGYVSLLPMYRADMSAVNGELETVLNGTVESDTEPYNPTADSLSDSQEDQPTFYSLLEAWTDVELRVNEGLNLPTGETVYELPKAAQTLIVSGDAELSDEDAVELTQAVYVSDDANGLDYALFSGLGAGLRTIVVESDWTEEDDEASEDGDTTEDSGAAEDSAPAEPAEPAFEDDPDPLYAYSRKSSTGDQYWVINTQARTVEFYRGDTDTYMMGDYTGSLISGMEVTFNTEPPITTTIQLKFKQTYKFAMMDDEGVSLLMEQDDVATVLPIMSGYRPD